MESMICTTCGQRISVPQTEGIFCCPSCGSTYEAKIIGNTNSGNDWLLPFIGGFFLGAIVFTGVGRGMVRSLAEASRSELESALEKRRRKLVTPRGREEVWR